MAFRSLCGVLLFARTKGISTYCNVGLRHALMSQNPFSRTTHTRYFATRYCAFYARNRCCTKVFLSAFLGFSLFSAKKDENTELKIIEETKQETKDENDDSAVILLLKQAKLAEKKSEFEKADELYHRALGLVNINQQHKTWSEERLIQARVYIYDSMANLALLRGRLEGAEQLFKQTLKGILQQGTKQDDNAVVEISLKLAMIYAMQNRISEAEQGYKFCIKTQEKKLKNSAESDDDTVALLGMSVDAYARFLVVQKQYSAALTNLQKALDIATSTLGENHQQVAVLLNDIATVASLTNDFDMAFNRLQRAISIAERMDSAHLPTLYCNLGAVHIHRGEFNDARINYRKAIKLAKQKRDQEALQKAEKALEGLKAKK